MPECKRTFRVAVNESGPLYFKLDDGADGWAGAYPFLYTDEIAKLEKKGRLLTAPDFPTAFGLLKQARQGPGDFTIRFSE